MGLRQRKKERTRDQLAATACHLFTERGYEATTVEDIAAAVEVSPRTFFRYFPTKGDVAVEILRAVTLDIMQTFADRPRTEPLMTSLRVAAHAPVDAHEQNADQAAKVLRMLCTNPSLRGRQLEEQYRVRQELAAQIADRLGMDQARDIRPRLIADLVVAALASVAEFWGASDGDADLRHLTEVAFDLLGAGLCALAEPPVPADLAEHAPQRV
ncbi:TetR family transcriptional regulator [Frankia sp. CNm7]|uniref:TetR family transcriptional regulator n=1 Tax=Frankia nepalensis TaxID=1836974 RepID=A0A937URK6_9ACTN|nr:TetR family transcriptional regulator [Frankia nepalensis]MBL7498038.1 TetR family transcriptional regulator [Frankia nepalensis]MBL7513573.1 TetR family transcriptional regulator [Frankia nepalensis]MBL7518544.1 TetR family transcriptional regulator [Frankia nepalensis]MBL7629340.1 TetR family transcriptional regulator [Frankia nepalensis]